MLETNWQPPPNLESTGGLMFHPGHPGPQYAISKTMWRKGKWTDAEVKYTKRLISAFNQGLLPISTGTTLRSYLSEKLNWYVF